MSDKKESLLDEINKLLAEELKLKKKIMGAGQEIDDVRAIILGKSRELAEYDDDVKAALALRDKIEAMQENISKAQGMSPIDMADKLDVMLSKN